MRYPWTRIARPGGPLLRTETGDGKPDLGVLRLLSRRPHGDPARRLSSWPVSASAATRAELIDAKAVGLPMLDRMYKEYPRGAAPPAMEALAGKIRAADAFVFVTGEYNWGMQPGLKNLTDHFLEEWFWRPAAIASYSAGRLAGARSSYGLARHPLRDGHGRDFQHAGRRPDRAGA